MKDDIVSIQILKNVNNQKETLQQKIDKHIGDSRNKYTAESEKKVAHEIHDQMKKVSTTLQTMTNEMVEKVENLTDYADTIQSNIRETILSVDNHVSNLAEQLETHSNKLEAFRSKLQELVVNTKNLQDGMVKIKSTAEKHVDSLHPNSTLGALNAQLNEINSRALLLVKSIGHSVYDENVFPFRNDIVTSDCINDLSSIKYNGIFTCEQDGFYLVSFFITSNTNVCHMSLYQNTNRIARASKGSDISNQTQSLLVILKLNIGDTLSVRAERNVSDWGGIYFIFSVLQVK